MISTRTPEFNVRTLIGPAGPNSCGRSRPPPWTRTRPPAQSLAGLKPRCSGPGLASLAVPGPGGRSGASSTLRRQNRTASRARGGSCGGVSKVAALLASRLAAGGDAAQQTGHPAQAPLEDSRRRWAPLRRLRTAPLRRRPAPLATCCARLHPPQTACSAGSALRSLRGPPLTPLRPLRCARRAAHAATAAPADVRVA